MAPKRRICHGAENIFSHGTKDTFSYGAEDLFLPWPSRYIIPWRKRPIFPWPQMHIFQWCHFPCPQRHIFPWRQRHIFPSSQRHLYRHDVKGAFFPRHQRLMARMTISYLTKTHFLLVLNSAFYHGAEDTFSHCTDHLYIMWKARKGLFCVITLRSLSKIPLLPYIIYYYTAQSLSWSPFCCLGRT